MRANTSDERRSLLLAACLFSCAAACEGELSIGTEEELDDRPARVSYGLPSDVTLAGDLWAVMASFETWAPFEGLEGFRPGDDAHGRFQKHTVNTIAASSNGSFPNGAIIASRNFAAEDETTLESITVMQKITGYDAERGDWFWVKFEVGGTVAVDERGFNLAGRIDTGDESGCIGCHTNAPDGDFVFSGGPQM
jgi:hypothetical protein